MPGLIPGTTTEQKTVTVANNDTAINASIATELPDDWLITLMVIYPDGSNIILLYSRTVTITF